MKDQCYKNMAAEGAWERYFEKQRREIPSRLTNKEIRKIDEDFGLGQINSIEDIISQGSRL